MIANSKEKDVANEKHKYDELSIDPSKSAREKDLRKRVDKNYFSEDFFEQVQECTYLMYGDIELKQEKFMCEKCDVYQLHPMCKSCFNICHKECQNDYSYKFFRHMPKKTIEKKNLPVSKEKKVKFVCLCGKIQKHQKIELNLDIFNSNKIFFCNLENFLKSSVFPTIVNKMSNCKNCQIKICYLCQIFCHHSHTLADTIEEGKDNKCMCSNPHHSLNDFILDKFLFDKKNEKNEKPYPVLISNRTKILNVLFKFEDVTANLCNFIKWVIEKKISSSGKIKLQNTNQNGEKFLQDSLQENQLHHPYTTNDSLEDVTRKFIELIRNFYEIFYNREDKCYFYNEKLKTIFAYDKIFLFINQINQNELNINFSKVTFNLIGIVFYLHVKANFQEIKNFTICDFMGSSIETRLRYRKIFMKIRNMKLEDSNFDDNLKKNIDVFASLAKNSLMISSILTRHLPTLDILKYAILYEIPLRYINFTLKKMNFTKSELLELINNLSRFFMKFFVIVIDQDRRSNLKKHLEDTRYVFYYMIKICYLIAVNYNDIVTEELIEEYKSTKNLSFSLNKNAYIHSNHRCGDKLFKMILKTVLIVTESYKSDFVIDRKIIDICNESLKIFSVTENLYFLQLDHIDINETNKENFTGNAYSLPQISFISGKMKRKLIDSLVREDETIYVSDDSRVNLEIDERFRELIKLFPYGEMTDDDPSSKNQIDGISHKDYKYERINNYKLKIIRYICNNIGLKLTNEQLTRYYLMLNSESFILNLISANFDEIISIYLSLFDLEYIDERHINAAFSFYLLYCLNERSLDHLCTGKNLSTITKLFTLPKNIKKLLSNDHLFEFLYLLIKGIRLFEINLSNNKSIDTILNMVTLINKEINIDNEIYFISIDEISFKVKQRILKILNFLKNALEFEEFKEVQNQYFYKFKKHFNSKDFKKHIDEYHKRIITQSFINNENFEEKKEVESKLNFKDNYFERDIKELNDTSKSNIEETTKLVKNNLESKKSGSSEKNILTSASLSFKINYKKSEELKFYFTFLHFFTLDTYYIFHNDDDDKHQLQEIHNFLDLVYIKSLLKENFLPLNYRTHLLRFLRTFYFIDMLHSESIDLEYIYISNTEYRDYLRLGKNCDQKIKESAELIKKIHDVMQIFAYELEIFEKIITKENYYHEDIKDYLIQLVYSVKIISDFVYYQDNILDKVIYQLYKIAKRFIKKTNIYIRILQNIHNRFSVGDFEEDEASNSYIQITKKMESINFDIYDKQVIYNLISESLFQIVKFTNVDKKFKLEKYLKEYDKKMQYDFTPPGMVAWKGYDEFYMRKENFDKHSNEERIKEKATLIANSIEEINSIEKTQKADSKLLSESLSRIYKTSFILFHDSCLMRVLNTFKTKDDVVDYRKLIINYFIKYMGTGYKNQKLFEKVSNKLYTEETTVTLLTIMVKLLYYDTTNTQNKFDILNSKYFEANDYSSTNSEKVDKFFKSFITKLRKVFVLNFSTSINFFMFNRYTEISELNKLMIQFLQLLSEGNHSNFKEKIFELKFSKDETVSIFDIMYDQFKIAYHFMDLQSNITNNNELSHYKLIVLFSNISDFLFEYTEGAETQKMKQVSLLNFDAKISKMFDKLFKDGIHKCLLIRTDDLNVNITSSKVELCKKLLIRVKLKIIELLIQFVQFRAGEEFIKNILKDLPLSRLFEEIQYNLKELILKFWSTNSINKSANADKFLMHLYSKDPKSFSMELRRYYIDKEEVADSLELKLCLKIFVYLNIMSDIHGIKTVKENFVRLKNNKKKGILLENNCLTSFSSMNAINVYTFMKSIVKNVEVKIIEDGKVYKTFFFKPPITFHLSKPTIRSFMEKVNRESRYSKLSSLIKQTDYFMYEMVYYSHFNKLGIRINKFLDLYYLEIFNYLFLILHQIFLFVNYYISSNLKEADYVIPIEEKYVVHRNNFILGLIQIAYIVIILVLWGIFQFPLILMKNLMANNLTTFLFNKEGGEKRQIIYKYTETSSIKGIFRHFDFIKNTFNLRGIDWLKKLKVGIVDCLFLNGSINAFLLSLIMIILYLTTGSAIFIVFPILFVININPILFGMFVAIRTKWQQFFTMLIFTYLCIYFFTWISFYFTYSLFEYDDVYSEKVRSFNL